MKVGLCKVYFVKKYLLYEVYMFQNIREPFIDAVKITLGDRYTANIDTIYRIAVDFILHTMSDGLLDALDTAAGDNIHAIIGNYKQYILIQIKFSEGINDEYVVPPNSKNEMDSDFDPKNCSYCQNTSNNN